MRNGFRDSKLELNKSLRDVNQWNENEIKNRASHLQNIALKVWQYPTSKFEPKQKEQNEYSLSDEYQFTNEKITSFSLDGKKREVNSWKNFYHEVALFFYDLDPSVFKSFLDDDDFKTRTRTMVSSSKGDLLKGLEISKDIFLECNLSTEGILSMVRRIVKKYGFDEDEISFYLKEKS